MLADLPGILGALIVFVGSLVALEKIRNREICRRREERLRAWILKDLPPIPD
jgi:hypothetical protein